MVRSQTFSVPEQGETYTRDIEQRCEDLINLRIWGGLEIHQLRSWMNTFVGSAERYFAARLLDALIYRSKPQTTALMTQLFQKGIPDLVRRNSLGDGLNSDWGLILSAKSADPGIRVVPVIKTSDPPTKSGPLVCRLLKRELGLSEKWMIWPSEVGRAIRRGISVFLFVDDFLGTGHQFLHFARSTNLEAQALMGNASFIYAPLVALEKGVERLKSKLPPLSIVAAEQLDESHCLFSERSPYFADDRNSPAVAKSFYTSLLAKRGITNLGRFTFGYARLSLAFAFEHATPNATLPLFWLDDDRIRPFFKR